MKDFKVRIPMVGQQQQVELIETVIIAHEKEVKQWFTGKHPSIADKTEEFKKLLEGVRAVEDGKQAHQSISLMLENRTGITGNSWQLGVAIVDRMVRLNPTAKKEDNFIVATGEIDTHDLTVKRVDDFSTKLAFLADYAQNHNPKNPVFAYPSANETNLSDKDKEALAKLKHQGWRVHGVSKLDDIQFLWSPTQKKDYTPFITTPLIILATIGLIWYKQCSFIDCPVPTIPIVINPSPISLTAKFRKKMGENEGYSPESPLISGMTLNEGDAIKLYFSSVIEGYLYLYYLDTKGNLTELFTETEQSNVVEKGENIVLPNNNDSFVVDANHGIENFYLIFSKNPENDIHPLYQQYQVYMGEKQINKALPLQQRIISRLEKHKVLSFKH